MKKGGPVAQAGSLAEQRVFAVAVEHFQARRLAAAERLFQQILTVNPRHADSLHLLGVIAYQTGRHDLAVERISKAIAIHPGEASLHSNLGNLLLQEGRLDEAVACYRRPSRSSRTLRRRTTTLATRSGREAAGRGDRQLPPGDRSQAGLPGRAQQPGDGAAGARRPGGGLGRIRVALEDAAIDQGPPRLRAAAVARRAGRGANAADPCRARLRRHAAILPLRAAGGGTGLRVILEVPSRWSGCCAACRASTGWWRTARLCRHSICTARCSACRWRWGPRWRRFPARALICTPTRRRWRPGGRASPRWTGRVLASGWSGRQSSRTHLANGAAVDRRRSIAPDRLAPLFGVPGLQFFSLQKDGPAAPGRFPLTDFMGEMGDFADTAALIANLDLVISVDTSVAHLAGALGKPVWLLDRFDPCWRWLIGRRDSPWYPTLRLFRQPRPGDWDRSWLRPGGTTRRPRCDHQHDCCRASVSLRLGGRCAVVFRAVGARRLPPLQSLRLMAVRPHEAAPA